MRNSKCVFKMKNWTLGQTLTNLVTNGDFSNGTTGWSTLNATHAVSGNVMSNTGNGSGASCWEYQNTTCPITNGKKVDIKIGAVRVTNANCVSIRLYAACATGSDILLATISNPVQNQWYPLSGVGSYTTQTVKVRVTIEHSYADAATANGKVMEIDGNYGITAIDLPAHYGYGNEPTAAQMDLIAPTWFNGTIKTGSLVPYTKVLDRSRYLNNGTLSGGAVYKKLPAPLYVLDFTSATSLVTVPKNASINDLSQFTFRAWVYYNGIGGGSAGRFFDKVNKFLLLDSTGRLQFHHIFSTTIGIWTSPTNSFVVAGYHCVQITYDNSTTANNPVIMIDGISVTVTRAQAPVGTALADSASNLILGNNVVAARSLNGYLSELEIYQGILTVAEGKRWYNATCGKYGKVRVP